MALTYKIKKQKQKQKIEENKKCLTNLLAFAKGR